MSLSDRQITIAPHPSVVAGPGVSASLADHVAATGLRRAFLVADRGVVGAGLVEPLTGTLDAAGIEHTTFSDVDPNPTDTNVAAGLDALAAFGEAAVVLVGGGSAMDCGKYLALAAANGAGPTDLAFHVRLGANDRIDLGSLAQPRTTERDGYPTLAIPTTSGTASETNGAGLITDTTAGRKLTFSHPSVRPQAVLLDPTLTVGLPAVPTATSGMDALVHAIECLSSTRATPYADGLALQTIRMVGEWLPRVVDDPSDLEARARMQLASHLAGVAFSSGPLLGLVHATGHPVSARLHQPHGQTLATMLPHVMRFNMEVVADRYALVAEALCAGRDADASIPAVEALSARVGTAKSLAELGADADVITTMVDDALSDLIILTTRRHPTRHEVHNLYTAALA